ncbi:superoxide dismutase [Candidatus Woesebacteria bacterium RIFCSPLOWO2_01_FULL_37_19]|uniref:Superoxide dismutase n=1 Tax=Candidatus Woesebacteria bacterium RIFCSPLOWO2_01_FULL_37_19 TaxID=1802514 RepID=A0A1F8BBI4_9BACT|nr:MAG: superoxide dismutase [Candidatus Woesebacteria bacterium RIFCSPLOWO2_01_FULL_37_19]
MFKLPDLPYPYDALEPFIDRTTMTIHHTKHHQAYIDNLNKALIGNEELAKFTGEELLTNLDKVPSAIKQAVINNAGGHINHSFFWKIMSGKRSEPKGELLSALNKHFGSFDNFKEEFTSRALGVFGSGWAFLIITQDGKLSLKRHSFQNSPLIKGNNPVLGIDVWEHAYYLKYQNRRAEYIDAWWNVVNWTQVEKYFNEAIKK